MKYALIVGVNKYKEPGNNLAGCVNDARTMVELCTYYGFNNISVLLDNAATKQNIEESLSEIIAGADTQDHIFYYHSGHGTQVADLDNDEIDGYDETLVTHDFTWANRGFTDDDLAAAIKPLGAQCTLHVMIDTCNSGTLTDVGAQKGARAKALPMPQEWQEIGESKRPTRKFGIKPAWKDGAQRHTLLSACKANEVSWEYKKWGKWRGLMTKSFEMSTQHRGKDRNVSWAKAHKRTRRKARRVNKNQHAELIGPVSLKRKRILGGASPGWVKNRRR